MNQSLPQLLLAGLASLAVSVGAARADLLADFDTGGDLQRWSAQGKITVQRTDCPPGPKQAGPNGPAGSAARIDTAGNSGLFIKAGQLPPDLSDFDTLRFWVHRDPEAAAPSTIEVRFYEADGAAWFWRLVVLDDPGWTEVAVPARSLLGRRHTLQDAPGRPRPRRQAAGGRGRGAEERVYGHRAAAAGARPFTGRARWEVAGLLPRDLRPGLIAPPPKNRPAQFLGQLRWRHSRATSRGPVS